MRCEQAKQLMNAYVDHEINDQELSKLNGHLDSCESCTVEFEEIKYMIQLMGEIDLKELPLAFEEELHEKLIIAAKEIQTEQSRSRKKFKINFNGLGEKMRQFRFRRILVAYAALPLVLVMIVMASKGLQLGLSKNESVSMTADFDNGMAPMETTGAVFGIGESEVVFTESFEKAKDSSLNFSSTIQAPESQQDVYREGRMIIQTANINMDVEKYDQVMETLKTVVTQSGGYIENESTSFKFYYSDTDNLKYGYITLRIPAGGYHSVMDQIKTLGLVTMESSNANDITKMYRDTASEIENLKVTESRLREIMQKAVEIADILAIENELGRVRNSINAYEKQIQDWEALVDMTTISIQLNEVKSLKPVVEPIDNSLFGKAREGFIHSINSIKRAIENFIIWVVANSPFLVLLSVLAVIISTIYKKRRAKK
ncbi:MAG TPA: hypothetical protein DCS67_11890 [Clostridiales bacterium UBA8960]|nr:hypothetical protein [Clostridiales bacterium UBA8960]